jgi:hypothetical protein
MTPQIELKAAKDTPDPARTFGLVGLVPFAGGALAVCFAPEIKAQAATALIAYGAVILSFLGGIRWGFAVLEGRRAGWTAYGLSVIPALIAWVGAVSVGPEGLLILALALALWFFAERATAPALPIPAWHIRLHAALTAIASLSLFAAAILW